MRAGPNCVMQHQQRTMSDDITDLGASVEQIADVVSTPDVAASVRAFGMQLTDFLDAVQVSNEALLTAIVGLGQQLATIDADIKAYRVDAAQKLDDKVELMSGRLHTFANFLQGVEGKVHDLVEMQQLLLDAIQGASNDRPVNTDGYTE